MPRKNPLPPDEAAICARVKQFREALGFSRVSFAKEIGEDSTAVVNIEHGRVPLRFATAKKIITRFRPSVRWLALGKTGDLITEAVALEKLPSNVSGGSLFSFVFTKYLASQVAIVSAEIEIRISEIVKLSTVLTGCEMTGVPWADLVKMQTAIAGLLGAALEEESHLKAHQWIAARIAQSGKGEVRKPGKATKAKNRHLT